MKIPEIKRVFRVKAPLEKAWSLLGDREKLGSCVPRCKIKVINEIDAEWRIDIVLKTVVLTTHVTKLKPPNHAAWNGNGRSIATVGSVDLKAISKDETEVTYKAVLECNGAMGGLMNFVIEKQMPHLTEIFIDCVKDNLE